MIGIVRSGIPPLRARLPSLRSMTVLAWSIVLAVFSNVSVAGEPSVLCEELRRMLSTPPFLLGHELEDVLDDRGTRRIPNLDIDRDGLIDAIYWSCPGQGSSTPADPCTMSIELSSGRKIEFQEYGFNLILHRSEVYAIAAASGHKRIAGRGKAWRVSKIGVNLVCSNL